MDRPVDRREFLRTMSTAAASVALASETGCAPRAASDRSPNIVFILADGPGCRRVNAGSVRLG
ncbi:MAG: twin-arginine translocation signal domain-containing protein [Gemmatimonadota bacterium]|nr:twin-arginine translocation signal domain-containing protein [Gemmatimonadota bacterium]MDH3367710.1 twin-arginine translocation signal domain-containing protein [Gemmatimonadota bacterium]MDH3479764.1 twin-arginine translocation signal domain-containing protein [Gemmatimonadota bacterium]MDH3571053.1 twin-arginine translocation signal domain-containing protein [Gemmatimonadota bacterium]MDH5549799.1 twin-arginine translocation signal domain-containing protein [Gemmatimonadota bacterium]